MGETYIQKKDFNTALAMYRLIVEGANSSGFAHYQRGRIYAMTSRKKEMLTELRLALSQGYHEPTAFDSDEFRAYREDVDFHALATDWKKAAK
jgi:hypothetical protein